MVQFIETILVIFSIDNLQKNRENENYIIIYKIIILI